jgi:hypothetical protein
MGTVPNFLGAVGLMVAALAAAQAYTLYGCDSAEAKQFDFWLGEWELSYVEDGKPAKSRNRVSRLLDGCAIHEEFSGAPGTKLEGRSYSSFDRGSKQWKQAWVDNSGAYLDFTGGLVDGRMILVRTVERDGRRLRQRMVWQDITGEHLKWLWQRSDDDGATWSTQWEIDYRRIR